MTRRRFARRLGVLTLAASLLLTPTMAFARKKKDDTPPATSGLIDNVNGLSVGVDGQLERFSGLLIDKEGRVERRFVAGEKRPERLAYRYDAMGRTLIPSFIDDGGEVIATGIALVTLDLSDTRSLAEAQAKITAYVREHPDRKWILGRGWDVARWGTPDRLPTAADLDGATGAMPAWLLSADGRTGWANSATLKLAGLTVAKSPGTFSSSSRAQIERIVPPPAPKDRDIALDKAQQILLARGYSTVADMGTGFLDWQSFRRAGDRGALRLRIVSYADGIDNMVAIAGPAPSPWLYDGRLRLVGVHIPIDKGTDDTRLRNWMSRAAMDGFQVALAPDNAATTEEAKNAVAEVALTYAGDRRWRVRSTQPAPASPFARLSARASGAGGVASALASLTSSAARDLFAEATLGSLAPGQWADFLLIDRDISSVAPADIAATRIDEHWIAGKRAYKNGEAALPTISGNK